MTTQNSSYSRILAVWMVLLAFLCGMILPSVAVAKLEMIIATDGDPDDGLDSSGGGSGDSGSGEIQSISDPDKEFTLLGVFSSPAYFNNQASWVVWFENPLGIVFVFPSLESSNWGGRR